MPTTATPTAAALRQFRLGLLPPDQAAAVEKWLTETPGAADELSRVVARDPVTDALCETLTNPPADTSVVPLAQPVAAADVPTAVGGFRVVRELGRGGMGVVLEAEDSQLGRRVALKLIGAGVAADGTARVRFQQEARAVAGIEHDNVVPVHQVGEDGGRLFLVMPLLKGETLYARLQRDSRLAAAEVVRIGRDVARGLAAAHAVGLVHRDVKPANVWLDADTGRARLLDFGLAKPLEPADDGDGPRTQAGAVIGTPHYMAPEQAEGKPVDHRADLFGLGALLYHAATGTRPFGGDTVWQVLHAVTADAPAPAEALNPDLPPHLARLIRALLAKSPADRPASAAAVAEALARPDVDAPWAALDDATEVIPTPPGRRPSARPPRRRAWQAVAAIAAGGLVALAGAFAVYQIEFKTKEGTLVVEVDGEVDARFKNGELQIFDSAGKLKYTLVPGQRDAKLPAGAYAVRVRGADGVALDTPAFTMTKDGRVIVRVTAKAAPIENQKSQAGLGLDAAINRRAALWVLSIGGTVQVDDWGHWINAADLPAGPFRLTGVSLFRNERVTDDGLANLANCRHLISLDLSLTGVGDRGVAHLRGLKGLTHLYMYGTRVADPGLADVAPLPRLVSLNVAMTGVTDAGVAPFKGRTDFVFLDLGHTKVTDAGLANFRGCKGLTFLGLNRTAVTDAGLEWVGGCSDLEELALEETRVTDAGLAPFKNCKGLRRLILAGTKVTAAGLAHFKDCTNLTRLGLDETRTTDAGLAHFKNCPRLSMVELVGTDVTDDGVAFLDGCVDLGVLKLDRTKVTAARIDKLKAGRPALWIEWSGGTLTSSLASDYRAALYAFSVGGTIRDHYTRRDHTSAEALPDRFQLTGARLRDNPKVTDTGLAVFAACSAVTDIDLSGTATGDAGLAAFRRCRALATLDLAGTRVTGAGLAALDGFADLTHVRLSGTAVDDAGLARLKDRPRLVYLDVRRTKVTAAAVREFAAARPQCKVEWDGGTVEPTR